MHRRVYRCLVSVVAIAALGLAGCATRASLPPVAPNATDVTHPGKFVWFDLLTEDVSAARGFYGEVFGWTFEDAPGDDDYVLIRSGSAAIGGLAPVDERDFDVSESLWLGSLSVADVDAAASLVKSRGGELIVSPVDVDGRGRLAAVRDPAGAPLVLLRASGGDPADANPPVGGWLWVDLWTDDASAAKAFYAELVGYETREVEAGPDHVYHVLGRDGRARAGLVEIDMKGIEPNWLPYVRVGNVGRTVERAREQGGSVLLQREDLAILIDPTGAAIGVQRHSAIDARSGS
jgi:predicted enzyme related to lactoylglutathione lyase